MNMNESLKIPLNALCSYIIKNIKNGNYKVESINFQEYPSDDIPDTICTGAGCDCYDI